MLVVGAGSITHGRYMSIVQIAQKAGVSTATVSRVLNDFPGVSEDTARHVRMAAEAMNYVPPRIKRGPKQGSRRVERTVQRTNTIAVITIGDSRHWLQMPVLATALAGISRAAKEHGFRLVLQEAVDPNAPVLATLDEEVDGAVVFVSGLNTVASDRTVAALSQRIPLVRAMGVQTGVASIDHVHVDQQAISYLAFHYLQEQGCEEFAFLTQDPIWPIMRHRGQAFINATFDAGKSAVPYVVTSTAREAEAFGTRAVTAPTLSELLDRLLATNSGRTGLFVCNDETTAAVYALLAEKGVRPQRDITIVSCDNEEIRLSAMNPRPASIDIGSEEVGRRAVRRLSFRMENPDESPMLVQISPQLVLPGAVVARAPLSSGSPSTGSQSTSYSTGAR